MCGDKIVIGEKTYRIHPEYLSFGIDKEGNIINIVSRELVKINREEMTVRLKRHMRKRKTIDLVRLIWETYYGEKPKRMMIVQIDGNENNFSVRNLRLKSFARSRKLSDDERRKNDEKSRDRWKKREWICPRCGKVTNNNASGYHKKVCTGEDKQMKSGKKRNIQ